LHQDRPRERISQQYPPGGERNAGADRATGHEEAADNTESDGIDPATWQRTILTTGAGAVVTVLDRTGRLLTLDDQANLVVRDPMTGRILAMAASNATLKGSGDASFSSSNAGNLVVERGESRRRPGG